MHFLFKFYGNNVPSTASVLLDLMYLNYCVIFLISWFPCCTDLLKGIFFEVKKKFETALGVLKKEKITIDPDDPTAVANYAQVMRTVREK